MAEDIFEGGIDLSLLAESEEGVFEIDETQTSSAQESKSGSEDESKEENNSLENKEEVFEIDESEIAELEDGEASTGESEEESEISSDESEEDKTNKDKKETPAEKEQASSADTLTSLATALKEAGVFSSLEDEDLTIESTDDLFKAIEKQIKTNEYSFLNEDQKEYLKALENGVPLEKYSETKSNVAQYENLKDEVIETNPSLAYELIRRKYIIDGASPEKADKFAKLSLKEENAVEDAKEAKSALIEYEKNLIKSEIEQREAERKAKVEEETNKISQLKSKVLESNDLIPGITLNTNTRDKVFQSLTSPSAKDKEGNPLNEVMDKYSNDDDYKLKLHALHVVTKGFTDFSKIEKTSKSKAVKEFEEKLKTGNNTATGAPSTLGSTGKSIKNALEGYVPAFKRK